MLLIIRGIIPFAPVFKILKSGLLKTPLINQNFFMKYFFTLVILALPATLFSQYLIQGTITDAANGYPLKEAGIKLLHTNLSTLSDAKGRFVLRSTGSASDSLEVSFLGYLKQSVRIPATSVNPLRIELQVAPYLSNEVFVRSTRSQPTDGTVYSSLGKQQIASSNLGQDLPYLLATLPSVVVTSDAGTGIGYTYIRIRGSDASRTNVTINGIPYNDAESQQTYFVDIPDLASSVENIQVQRGVGTSSNGAGAFGGSLNIQTNSASPKSYAELDNSYGSYNSLKNTLKFSTGPIGRWNFDGRLSRISSDGYIERGSALLKSLYFSAAYTGKADLLRFNVFAGAEKTYQAYYGVPEDSLPHHRRYNSLTYPNQTDNYTQDNYQILYSKRIGDAWLLNGALHLTHGKGYYEEYEASQLLSNYSIAPVVIGATTIDTSNLIRRQWLDNYFYGATWSAENHTAKDLDFTFGGAYNEYRGLHYGEVIWAQFASNSQIRSRYYDNNGIKTDFNLYGKESWKIGNLSLNLDLQYRRVHYQFNGTDEFKMKIDQKEALNFFNPKFGISYKLGDYETLYVSYGVANKEPNRDDYVQATAGKLPKPENLQDLETGIRHTGTSFSGNVNLFYMNYYNQLVQTGKLNDVGNPVRTNVPFSYRAGIELEGAYKITDHIIWKANLTLSSNKIREYHETLYNENNTALDNIYHHSNIAFSPSIIGSSIFDFLLIKDFHASLVTKYVGKQYLDNTSHANRKIEPYFLNDIRFNYKIISGFIPNMEFLLALNNIMNVLYVSNGSAYPYVQAGRTINSNYYYPQAPFNVSVGVNFRF